MWRSTAVITITLALSILATALLADAQLPGQKIPRIGYLQDTSPSIDPHRYEAFLHRACAPTAGRTGAYPARALAYLLGRRGEPHRPKQSPGACTLAPAYSGGTA